VKRFATHLRARWRSFRGEADAIRESSIEISTLIRARQTPDDSRMAALPQLGWPVHGRVTSRFGMRHGRLHEGVDISAPHGAPVHTALGGVVIRAGTLPGYGNLIVVGHGASFATVYAHLESVEVAEDDRVDVQAGSRLGTVGSTGRSFGAHLHFEVRFDGTAVDPLVLLNETDVTSPLTR